MTEVPLLAERLRRYSFAYTASHDPSICDDLMVDDYTLHMGEYEIRGRDLNYKPAAIKQLRQFPGLGMSVHDLLITPERAALQFSEYGRSAVTGTTAAWAGVSMYHWDGDRLTDCRVEQDYYSRRAQLRSDRPHPIEPVAHDPWAVPIETPDPRVEQIARSWITDNGTATLDVGSVDDEPAAPPARIVLADPSYEILDCFSGAERAAFHVTARGTVAAWPGAPADLIGRPALVYYAGLATIRDGRVSGARVISDRLAVERRMRAASS